MNIMPLEWIVMICLLLGVGCSSWLNHGFFDRKEFLTYREISSVSCIELDYCPSLDEIARWKKDSVGKNGDRRNILFDNRPFFKDGGIIGASYDCVQSLIGSSNKEYWIPEYDSIFHYYLYQSKDSAIFLTLQYNTYFDKIVQADLIIHLKNPPYKKKPCPANVYRSVDSILYKTYSYELSRTRKNEEVMKLRPIFRSDSAMFVGESVECLECYIGSPNAYILRYSNGLWGNDDSYEARFKGIYNFDISAKLSIDSSMIRAIYKGPIIYICG